MNKQNPFLDSSINEKNKKLLEAKTKDLNEQEQEDRYQQQLDEALKLNIKDHITKIEDDIEYVNINIKENKLLLHEVREVYEQIVQKYNAEVTVMHEQLKQQIDQLEQEFIPPKEQAFLDTRDIIDQQSDLKQELFELSQGLLKASHRVNTEDTLIGYKYSKDQKGKIPKYQKKAKKQIQQN